MDSKKKILIIHPEGNIFNNPNLLAIAKNLSNDFDVDVLMPNKIYTEKSEFEIISYKPFWNKVKNKIDNYFLYNIVFNLFSLKYKKKYDFIFGVDRLGIIDACFFSKKLKCNYGLISYEIFFEDETSKKFKAIEIKSCKDISFSIVQDEKRGQLLSEENKISNDKMIYIPVASDGIANKRNREFILHKKFNLSFDVNILIFIGSVAEWTCIDEILEKANNFLPQNWVLVIHDRYGKAKKRIEQMGLINILGKNIFLIEDNVFSFDEINSILSDAELGLVGYRSIYGSPYTGKNIAYIGLSSGKFSTYMKNGLPALVYNSKDLGEVVINEKLGLFVDNFNDLNIVLNNFFGREFYECHCIDYFNHVLSFQNFKYILKRKLDSCMINKT